MEDSALDSEADIENLMNKYEDFDKKPEVKEDTELLATSTEENEEEQPKDY